MDQNSIQKIYDEIGQLQIELEPDPTVLGSRYINEITAKCRNHLNRVTLIRLRLSREKRALKSQLAGEETLLAAERDRLLAEDETVRRQPNLRDREAVANTMLRERLNSIAKLKNELLDLDTVEKAVTLVHDELIRTSNEIKTQRTLVLADRSTGAAYGDEYDGPRGRGPLSSKSDIDERELDRLMEAEEAELNNLASEAMKEAQGAQVNTETQEKAEETEKMSLPEGLDSTPSVKVETLPEPIKVNTNQPGSKKDPSADLSEDQDVLKFLESDFNIGGSPQVSSESTASTEPAKTKKVDEMDDFFADFLQNI